MIALAGPLHLLAGILVISGIGKIAAPHAAGKAMADARLPGVAGRLAVAGTAVGVVEAAVGLVAIAVASWWPAAAVASVYLGFLAFLARLRVVDTGAGCGCFGATSAPPGPAHWVFDGLAAAAAATIALAAAMTARAPDIVDVFDDGALVAVTYGTLLAAGSGAILLGLAASAELSDARSTRAAATSLARVDGFEAVG